MDEFMAMTPHITYNQLINSPKRELKLFDERTGGVEHVSVDNMSYGRSFIADWIAETFAQAAGSQLNWRR
jgi:hypothetical protein